MGAKYFDGKRGMGRTAAVLTNFSPLALWKEKINIPDLKLNCQLHYYVYLEIRHSTAFELMILVYVSVAGKESSFCK